MSESVKNYYTYHGNTYLVTHGGLSTIPQNLTFVATDQMIHGVGRYNDVEQVADTFFTTTDDHTYQIFGHRNTKGFDINVNPRVYDLEGQVEFGGYLRCVDIVPGGNTTYKIKNDVFREPVRAAKKLSSSVADVLVDLRHNSYISEKQFGNISSFNFTPAAFYEKKWNEQTTKARGLYIDTVREYARLQGFPDWFEFCGSDSDAYRQIGNAVAVPMGRWVGSQIVKYFNGAR